MALGTAGHIDLPRLEAPLLLFRARAREQAIARPDDQPNGHCFSYYKYQFNCPTVVYNPNASLRSCRARVRERLLKSSSSEMGLHAAPTNMCAHIWDSHSTRTRVVAIAASHAIYAAIPVRNLSVYAVVVVVECMYVSILLRMLRPCSTPNLRYNERSPRNGGRFPRRRLGEPARRMCEMYRKCAPHLESAMRCFVAFFWWPCWPRWCCFVRRRFREHSMQSVSRADHSHRSPMPTTTTTTAALRRSKSACRSRSMFVCNASVIRSGRITRASQTL